MALVQREITGTLKKADGAEYAGAEVRFSISDTQAEEIIIPKKSVVMTTNAQGVFSGFLYTLAGEYVNYTVTLPGGDSYDVSFEDAGEGEITDLADLIEIAASAELIAIRAASETVLGGIKIGDGLEIDENGVVSATGGGGGGGGETTTTLGALINSATAKATPADADMLPLMDSAASNIVKKLSWANVKATLKTYFDTLYQPLNSILTNTTASFTTAQETKLSGIATGATANDTDANLKNRANHTGTQAASTISDFAATVLATVLTGLSTATNATISATDTVLQALGKLQAQVSSRLAIANNLSDLNNAATARTNLGLGNVDNTSDLNKPVSTATTTALAAKADNDDVVHNSGDETVAGVKTFSSSPIVPTPTTDFQAATKKYVDDNAGGGGIGGSTGSTDNAILRADGTAGDTAQSSAATLSDAGLLRTASIETNSVTNIAPNGLVIESYNTTLRFNATNCNIEFLRNSASKMEIDDTTHATDTAVIIYLNGVSKRVSVGAADSGGSGYKVLRIPN